jgi:NADH-quinone oxidoreductase subunit H
MIVDIGIVAVKAFLVLFMVLNLAGVLGWIERKGSALIQDRIGANRASVLGFAGMGLVNTLIADPLKFLTKEDLRPSSGRQISAHAGAVYGVVYRAGDFCGNSIR